MKKIFLILLSFSMILVPIATSSDIVALASDDLTVDKNTKIIEGKRLLTSTNVINSDNKYDYIEEKDGQESILKYNIKGNIVEGQLYDSYENKNFDFVVEKTSQSSELKTYKGETIDSNFEVTFYQKRIKGNQLIQLNIVEKTDDEDSLFAASYVFDGKPINTKSYKVRHENEGISNNENTNDTQFIIMDDSAYYEHIRTFWARGMRIEVRGPTASSKSSSPNHSVRLNTIEQDAKDDVNFAFEPQNVSVTHTSYDLSGNNATVYNPVNPNSSGTTGYQFPIYLGSILGVQWLPVTTGRTTISGIGSKYFSVDFVGPTYLDEYVYNDTDTSKERHGILVEWKMNEGTIEEYLDDYGRAINNVDSYIRYKIDNGKGGTLYELAYREYTSSFDYWIFVN